jgi:hypothetical protein
MCIPRASNHVIAPPRERQQETARAHRRFASIHAPLLSRAAPGSSTGIAVGTGVSACCGTFRTNSF